MSRQKKIFAILAVVFVALLLYASYDISRRTTFPGSKPSLRERPQEPPQQPDSLTPEIPDSTSSGLEEP